MLISLPYNNRGHARRKGDVEFALIRCPVFWRAVVSADWRNRWTAPRKTTTPTETADWSKCSICSSSLVVVITDRGVIGVPPWHSMCDLHLLRENKYWQSSWYLTLYVGLQFEKLRYIKLVLLKKCYLSWGCYQKKITKIQKLENGIPFSILIDKQFVPSNKPINSLGLQFVAVNYVRIV